MQALTFAKQRSTTIRDIANEAGVSVGTVSRIINGAKNVKPEIYQRTMDIIKERRYSPRMVTEFLGKSVVKRKSGLRTGNIGVLFYDTAMRWQNSQIYLNYLRGIEKACAAKRYHPIVEAIPRHFDSNLPRCVVEGKVDGMLFRAQQFDAAFIENMDRLCPVVMVNVYRPALRIHQIVSDDYGAAVCITEHLIGLGHRRIAFVNMQPHHHVFVFRSQGYVEAMKVRGMHDPSLLIEMDIFGPDFNLDLHPMPSLEPIVDALLRLDPIPTAVIFANDWAASESYKPLKKRGIRIGKDLSLVGFDDILPLCELLEPSLSSLMIPHEKIAEIATSVLIEKIEGDRENLNKMPMVQMLPGTIKHRDSLTKIG